MSTSSGWDEAAFVADFFGNAEPEPRKKKWDEAAFVADFFGEQPQPTAAEQSAFTNEMPGHPQGAAALSPRTRELLQPNAFAAGLRQAYEAGADEAWRSYEATANLNNPEVLARLAAERGAGEPPALRNIKELHARLDKERGDTFTGAASAVAEAAATHPEGAVQFLANQLPNSVNTGLAMATGFGLAGPPGMWGGYVAATMPQELGSKALERTAKKESLDGVVTEAGLKTAGLALADWATFGLTKYMAGAVGRHAERAVAGVLVGRGVDPLDNAAVRAALADPVISAEAQAAKDLAIASATTVPRKAGAAAAGFGVQTLGELGGEWAGERMAGNDPRWGDLILEAAAGAGLSVGELIAAKEMGDPGKMVKALERATALQKAAADMGLPPINIPQPSAPPASPYGSSFGTGTSQTEVSVPGPAFTPQSLQTPNWTQGSLWAEQPPAPQQAPQPAPMPAPAPPVAGTVPQAPGGPAEAPGADPPAWSGFPEGVPTKARPYLAHIQTAAQNHGIPPDLLAALAHQESGWNPAAVSEKGATGLMQFMPGTARRFGIDPRVPEQAIEGSARYLRALYDEFGSWDLALAGYNAGEGAVRKYKNQIPPYRETQDYVKKVQGLRSRYGGQAGSNAAPVAAIAGLAAGVGAGGDFELEPAPGAVQFAPPPPLFELPPTVTAPPGPAENPFADPYPAESTPTRDPNAGDRYLQGLMSQAQALGISADDLQAALENNPSFASAANEIQRVIARTRTAQQQQDQPPPPQPPIPAEPPPWWGTSPQDIRPWDALPPIAPPTLTPPTQTPPTQTPPTQTPPAAPAPIQTDPLRAQLLADGWKLPESTPSNEAQEARLTRRGYRRFEEKGGAVVESAQGLLWAKPPAGWTGPAFTPAASAPPAPALKPDIQELLRKSEEEIASRAQFAQDNAGRPFTVPVETRPGAMVSVTPGTKGYDWQVTYWPEGMGGEPSGDMQASSYAGAIDLVNQYRGDLTAARFDDGLQPREKGAPGNLVGRAWDSPQGRRVVTAVRRRDNGDMVALVKTGDNDRQQEVVPISDIDKLSRLEQAQADQRKPAPPSAPAGPGPEADDDDGFMPGVNAARRANINMTLAQKVSNNGRLISRRDLVRERIAAGATVERGPKGDRRLTSRDGAFLDVQAISKIGMDYAEHLLSRGRRDGAAPPAPPAPTSAPVILDTETADKLVNWINDGQPTIGWHKTQADLWESLTQEQQDQVRAKAEAKLRDRETQIKEAEERNTRHDAALEALRDGNPPTEKLLRDIGYKPVASEYAAPGLFHLIAGGTMADAKRAVNLKSLVRGSTSDGVALVDMLEVVRMAQAQVRKYGFLDGKQRMANAKTLDEMQASKPTPTAPPSAPAAPVHEEAKSLEPHQIPHEITITLARERHSGGAKPVNARDAAWEADRRIEALEEAIRCLG